MPLPAENGSVAYTYFVGCSAWVSMWINKEHVVHNMGVYVKVQLQLR